VRMPVRSCRVTIRDMSGVDHTVQVTAGTLYEAVAIGLASIRTDEWTEGIPDGLNVVKVSASNVPVEHSVQIKDFTAWLKKEGGSPRESSDRLRIRQILGIVANK
jgi:hypothetical protein